MADSADLIPIVWMVDVEPARRQIEEPEAHWGGVPETVALLEQWRPALHDSTGAPVHFSWFWRADPQVDQIYGTADWGFIRYRHLLETTLERGDEHGIHPHFWRRLNPNDIWIDDYLDVAWMEHCVRVNFEAFERQVGYPPRTNRCGTRYLDSGTARLLDRMGIDIDVTVEPGVPSDSFEANSPRTDYTDALDFPYQPAEHDFLQPRQRASQNGLTILPLTTRSPFPGGAHPFFQPYDEPAETTAAVDALLARGQRYLAFAFRSDAPVSDWVWPNVDALLEHLRGHPAAARFVFATPSEALTLLGV